MARNIVQEKRDAENKAKSDALENAKAPKVEEAKEETKTNQEEKIVYITTEQVTLNNLNVIMAQLDMLHSKMIEGLKQVGVVYPEELEDPKAQ